MIKKTFRGVVHVIGGLGAGLAILVFLASWQLSKGPVSLGFLSPYIEKAINASQRDFKFKMKETTVSWAGWDKTLDIRVIDVAIVGPGNNVIGTIPEVSFSLSGEALYRGQLAPRSIELLGPQLKVRRTRDGGFDVGFGEAGAMGNAPTLGLVKEFLDGTSEDHPLHYLARMDIVSADVILNDQVLHKDWRAPATDIHLSRDSLGVQGRVSLVLDLEGKQTELEVLGRYHAGDRRLDLTADLDKVSLGPFASVLQDLAPLRGFHLPLHGSIAVSIPLGGGPESIRFDLKGGKGELELPQPFGERVPIESVVFKGSYTGDTQLTEIENLQVELGANWSIQLPSPVDHKMPLRKFSMKAAFDGVAGVFNVFEFNGDLQGPAVSMVGSVAGIGGDSGIVVDIGGELSEVPVSDIGRYWPRSMGTDAHDWISKHISEGTVRKASAKARLSVNKEGAFVFESVNGGIKVEGGLVDYLPPMPKVRVDVADMAFDKKSFNISVHGGKSQNLSISEGTINFTGLDQVDQYADIHLLINGDLKSKLAYIDHKPLGFAAKLGFDPKNAKGEAHTDLKLAFMLEHALTREKVNVLAESKIENVTLSNVFLGRDIHDSTLNLKADTKGMTVTGDVKFESIPAQLVWRENFGKKQIYRRRYDLSAVISDVARIEDLGLDMEPFSGDYVQGALGANIRFTVFDDVDRRLEVSADITDASLSAPSLGWGKEVGVPGRAEIVFDLERDVVVDIPRFSVKAADLQVKGVIKYAADGTGLNRIEFSRLAYGRTDLKGALIPKNDGGWEAGFHGKSFDLSPFWEDISSGDTRVAGEKFVLPKLTLATEIEKVWITDKEYLQKVSGTFDYENELWNTVLLTSTIDNDTTFELAIHPGNDGNRQFSMRSSNAGKALRFLDVYDNMSGGTLNITGAYDDAVNGEPLKGIVDVKDYRIINAPALTQAISILALTGILEALSGDGLSFDTLNAPFTLHEGTFTLEEARASGVSLGFTASGRVYTHADVLDVEGTVVPAYALNSALGNIPLLGDILTGGEKGGGVFAANFSMTGSMEDPEIKVNPLSALTPGFLRNVFGVFDKGDPAANRPPIQPQNEQFQFQLQ